MVAIGILRLAVRLLILRLLLILGLLAIGLAILLLRLLGLLNTATVGALHAWRVVRCREVTVTLLTFVNHSF